MIADILKFKFTSHKNRYITYRMICEKVPPSTFYLKNIYYVNYILKKIFYQLSVHEYVHMSVAPYKTTSKTNIQQSSEGFWLFLSRSRIHDIYILKGIIFEVL